jgi:DNA-directed RNA polymerase specialized sigma24 family protein
MTIATVNASEDQSQYVGQVYQQEYARLEHYCRTQLGDTPEAEACVHETIRRFFFFMEERDWEAEAEIIPVYLIRIAGLICSRKLGEKRLRRSARPECNTRRGLFNKIRTEAAETMKERIELVKSALRPAAGGGRQSTLTEVPHA